MNREIKPKYPCSEKCIETTVCDDSCHLFEAKEPKEESELEKQASLFLKVLGVQDAEPKEEGEEDLPEDFDTSNQSK